MSALTKFRFTVLPPFSPSYLVDYAWTRQFGELFRQEFPIHVTKAVGKGSQSYATNALNVKSKAQYTKAKMYANCKKSILMQKIIRMAKRVC